LILKIQETQQDLTRTVKRAREIQDTADLSWFTLP